MKYRKKPVVIEAVKWTGSNRDEIDTFLGLTNSPDTANHGYADNNQLIIKTLEGNHAANPGDMIIKGVKGEFYPCKPDIFEATYEEVKE